MIINDLRAGTTAKQSNNDRIKVFFKKSNNKLRTILSLVFYFRKQSLQSALWLGDQFLIALWEFDTFCSSKSFTLLMDASTEPAFLCFRRSIRLCINAYSMYPIYVGTDCCLHGLMGRSAMM